MEKEHMRKIEHAIIRKGTEDGQLISGYISFKFPEATINDQKLQMPVLAEPAVKVFDH
ncbi:hypothetical protein [uncultured Desulfosarcina sp.]|uniref:hypothetical protein n=1 Tax=uncultured Desulfosarcina sp. TaxID=218289 RepID=UPI0029C8DBFE|nr:hypothetical protein [uncultured Desulfosarcina sp.]